MGDPVSGLTISPAAPCADARLQLVEEGPREGFQIEDGPISTAAKIELIDALSQTGVGMIQIASFVSAKAVPGWADADAVAAGFSPRKGVGYRATWLNAKGMNRALAHADRLIMSGMFSVSASEAFSLRNLRRDRAGQIEAMREMAAGHREAGVTIDRLVVMAAFGCNFQGDVPVEMVEKAIEDGMALAGECGLQIAELTLADSMGWCSPGKVRERVGLVARRWPDLAIALHLHDTRGLGIASAHAGLEMGVRRFDAAVGGLGGCPFAGQRGAPGNIATEELVLLCEQMGIETGVDLDALIAAGRLAEHIVGHALPSAVLRSGPLKPFAKLQ